LAKTKSVWVAGRGYDKRIIASLPKAEMLFQEVRVRSGQRIPRHYHARAGEHFFVFEAAAGLRFLNDRKRFSPRPGDYFAVKARTTHAVDASKVKGKKPAATFFVAKENYSSDDSVWL
jgi:quercetin dioxygenase-like cupin family protein